MIYLKKIIKKRIKRLNALLELSDVSILRRQIYVKFDTKDQLILLIQALLVITQEVLKS